MKALSIYPNLVGLYNVLAGKFFFHFPTIPVALVTFFAMLSRCEL